MFLEVGVPTIEHVDSFLELFDRYTRRTADVHAIPDIIDRNKLVNKIDVSALSLKGQAAFRDWLISRPYTQISIGNALRRGRRVHVTIDKNESTHQIDYSVYIHPY